MKTQTSFPKAHVYHPDITFEDTNLVGNVYFANYVRWQNECRNEWLKGADPETYASVFQGANRVCVTELAVDFHDPAGATVGDEIEVEMSIERLGSRGYCANSSTRRRSDSGSSNGQLPLANGHQRFEIVTGNEDIVLCNSHFDEKAGPAYQMDSPVPLDACSRNSRFEVLDMIRWQGMCRERFLSDHAPGTLKSVVVGALALHTSRVWFQLLHDVPIEPMDRLTLEMRLTYLKGGRLTVQFDYFVSNSLNRALAGQRFAIGAQSLCCKRVSESSQAPAVFPADMLLALRRFTESAELRSNIEEALDFVRSDLDNGLERTDEDRLDAKPFTAYVINLIDQAKE